MADLASAVFDLQRAISEIAQSCRLPKVKVRGAVDLLEEGNTIPFIARYRKEKTGGLDETQLREVEDALTNVRELADRKRTVLAAIESQGKLTEELRKRIVDCRNKADLEELYLPFKPKKRTRATVARERGLGPLAKLILKLESGKFDREQVVAPFVSAERGVLNAEAAVRGACDIVAEAWANNPNVRGWLRQQMRKGTLVSKYKPSRAKAAAEAPPAPDASQPDQPEKSGKAKKQEQIKREQAKKYEQYFDYRETLKKVPSHRFLAMRRGSSEGHLNVGIALDDAAVIRKLTGRLVHNFRLLFCQDLIDTVADCYSRLLFPSIENETLQEKKEHADKDAINVFGQNLRELLMAPPAGERVVMGIDPGFRTGCKVVVISPTGKLLDHATIYPTPPKSETEQAAGVVNELVDKHHVELIAIGNGTASRETDTFITKLLKDRSGESPASLTVSESGASVYSASKIAKEEFPDLDVTIRGAISIARRLQDPLAELVKIDPKSIGVGQYQHDVNQGKLRHALAREVESCVNQVGVDLNTASEHLLGYVAGIGPKLATAIRLHRDEHGAFASREKLREVPRLGERAFQQSAGFLRVRGEQPLDVSGVHPESYYVVEKIAAAAGVPTAALVGNAEAVESLEASVEKEQFVDDNVGLPTIEDIFAELKKPGRDPRNEFRMPSFAEGIDDISDLAPGMVLEGMVTNVTRFGAFVDIGVHQDGLVHVSELDQKYVSDPTRVVSVGDIVKVKVLTVDPTRRRISLSRKQAQEGKRRKGKKAKAPAQTQARAPAEAPAAAEQTAPAEQAASEQATSAQAAPDQAAPDQSASPQAASESAASAPAAESPSSAAESPTAVDSSVQQPAQTSDAQAAAPTAQLPAGEPPAGEPPLDKTTTEPDAAAGSSSEASPAPASQALPSQTADEHAKAAASEPRAPAAESSSPADPAAEAQETPRSVEPETNADSPANPQPSSESTDGQSGPDAGPDSSPAHGAGMSKETASESRPM